jgi:hypothetical protein
MIYIYALKSFFADAILAGFNGGIEPEHIFFLFCSYYLFSPGFIVIRNEHHCFV